MYFAVTSNTVPFRSAVGTVHLRLPKFNVYGFLSFDVLFQFNPLPTLSPISRAMLALRVGKFEHRQHQNKIDPGRTYALESQGEQGKLQNMLVLHTSRFISTRLSAKKAPDYSTRLVFIASCCWKR